MDAFSNTLRNASQSLSQQDLNRLLEDHASLLEELPDEALISILNRLDSKSLAKTCKASTRLRALCEEENIKKKLDLRPMRKRERALQAYSDYLAWSIVFLLKYSTWVHTATAQLGQSLRDGKEEPRPLRAWLITITIINPNDGSAEIIGNDHPNPVIMNLSIPYYVVNKLTKPGKYETAEYVWADTSTGTKIEQNILDRGYIERAIAHTHIGDFERLMINRTSFFQWHKNKTNKKTIQTEIRAMSTMLHALYSVGYV